MSTSVSSVVSHFPDAENGFTTTTAGSVSSGAGTVTLNSVAGYTNGEPVVLVIDPTDAAKKQTFTGIVDTSGVQITSVVWTAGTNQSHALGATVVDYATATHIAMMSKGIKVNHTQKGNHKTLTDDNANEWIEQGSTASAINQVKITNAAVGTSPIISASGDDTNIGLTLTPKGTGNISMTSRADGWVTGLTAPTTVTANGNRSYDVVINSTDYTDRLSAGMRIRTTRTVAAPTQCTDLEASSSQYYSKTSPSGISFTTTFTCSAWIKLESYTAGGIIARRNADTEGWSFEVNASGQLQLTALRIAGNIKYSVSYQSLPLNKWVHVAASMDVTVAGDASTVMYFDGVVVPHLTTTVGTCTALVQGTTALVVGAIKSAGTSPFDGKIAQAAVYSAVISAANIRATMSQTLSGSETNLVSAYSFNNSIVDLNANANNLTAQGSAVATATDSPFGGQADGTISSTLDYAIITKTAFSTNTTLTVQVPEGCTIPTSGGVSAVSYSTQKVPYGMPIDSGKWTILSLSRTDNQQASPSQNTWYNIASFQISLPIGAWQLSYQCPSYATKAPATSLVLKTTLSTTTNTETDTELTAHGQMDAPSATYVVGQTLARGKFIAVTAATPYYLNSMSTTASVSTIYNAGSLFGANILRLENAYL